MNKGLGKKIKDLRDQGLSYRQIEKKLGCSKSTICYHLGQGQKAKFRERNKKRHPFKKKINEFCNQITHNNKKISTSSFYKKIHSKIRDFSMSKDKIPNKPSFTFEDVLEKFGENPVCYLTGDPINIHEPSSYHFDHIIPRSKGGDNSLDNLGLCTKEANFAKRDMTPEQFLALCAKVVNKASPLPN